MLIFERSLRRLMGGIRSVAGGIPTPEIEQTCAGRVLGGVARLHGAALSYGLSAWPTRESSPFSTSRRPGSRRSLVAASSIAVVRIFRHGAAEVALNLNHYLASRMGIACVHVANVVAFVAAHAISRFDDGGDRVQQVVSPSATESVSSRVADKRVTAVTPEQRVR